MSYNTSKPGAATTIAELEVRNNPDMAVVDACRVRGGGFAADTIANRDAIPFDLRKKNVTKCYVEANGVTYVLRDGIDNEHWIVDAGGGSGSALHLTGNQQTLLFTQGQSATGLSINLANLFVVATGRQIASVVIKGLPEGITQQGSVSQPGLTGTPATSCRSLYVITVRDTAGDACQYVGECIVSADSQQIGNVQIDCVFGLSVSGQVVEHDFDIALQINQPGFALHGQRCKPGPDNTRFIDGTTVESCVAVAAKGFFKSFAQNPLQKDDQRFYRFGISLAQLRSRYSNLSSLRLDIYAKRKPGNWSDAAGNVLLFRVGKDVSNGLKSSGETPIDFATRDRITQGEPADYRNGGQGYAVGAAETLIAYLTIDLASGNAVFTAVAEGPAPTDNTPQLILIDGPLVANVGGSANAPQLILIDGPVTAA